MSMEKREVHYWEFCATVAKDHNISPTKIVTITKSRKGNPVEPRNEVVYKGHSEIAKEAGIKIQSSRCRVSEGNGCHSMGEKLTYKGIFCIE